MRRWIVLALALCFAVTACGGNKTATKPPANPKATPNNLKESSENRLPADFPSDFPLPSDKKVVYSASNPQTTVVFLQSAKSSDDLKTLYLTELPKAGWQIKQCTKAPFSPEPVTVLIAFKGKRIASMALGYVPSTQFDKKIKSKWSYYVAFTTSPTDIPASSPAAC